MKIAQFKSLEHDYICIDSEKFEIIDGYIRLTEYTDVEFIPLKDESIITKQVDFIDNKIKQAQAVSEAKINELTQQRNELLAIPHIKAV